MYGLFYTVILYSTNRTRFARGYVPAQILSLAWVLAGVLALAAVAIHWDLAVCILLSLQRTRLVASAEVLAAALVVGQLQPPQSLGRSLPFSSGAVVPFCRTTGTIHVRWFHRNPGSMDTQHMWPVLSAHLFESSLLQCSLIVIKKSPQSVSAAGAFCQSSQP